MTSFPNRRLDTRVEINEAKVRFRRENPPDMGGKLSDLSFLKNISLHGICFESQSYLQKNECIQIEITAPNNQVIRLRGKIIWSSKNTLSGNHRAGLRFSDFNWGDSWDFNPYKSRLNQLIELQKISPKINKAKKQPSLRENTIAEGTEYFTHQSTTHNFID